MERNGNSLVGFSKNGIKAGSPVGLISHTQRPRGKGLAISAQTKWRLLISVQSNPVGGFGGSGLGGGGLAIGAAGFAIGAAGNLAGSQQQDDNVAQFSLMKRDPEDDTTGFAAGTHRRHGVGITNVKVKGEVKGDDRIRDSADGFTASDYDAALKQHHAQFAGGVGRLRDDY